MMCGPDMTASGAEITVSRLEMIVAGFLIIISAAEISICVTEINISEAETIVSLTDLTAGATAMTVSESSMGVDEGEIIVNETELTAFVWTFIFRFMPLYRAATTPPAHLFDNDARQCATLKVSSGSGSLIVFAIPFASRYPKFRCRFKLLTPTASYKARGGQPFRPAHQRRVTNGWVSETTVSWRRAFAGRRHYRISLSSTFMKCLHCRTPSLLQDMERGGAESTVPQYEGWH